jgi:hypothetical protein
MTRLIKVGKGKVTGNKFTRSQTYVAGQSRKVLEARAKKLEAKWKATRK